MANETTNTHGGAREGAGAPLGNQNSIKSNRYFAETIKRMVKQSDGEVLRKIAQALIDKAEDGDLGAIKEFADRVDGKAMQENKMTGDENAPIVLNVITGVPQPLLENKQDG
jgi:N-methylhydantoinase B/oxoprolinase/acetone carboxylase alpha subunit